MRSGKLTCFSMVPFVPGSFYAKKNPKLLSLRCLQYHRRVFPQETKVRVQVLLVEVEARQEITKRIFPRNPLVIDLDPQHVVGGGQEVQEVIYQYRELEKTAQIQKGMDCEDASKNSLTVMMMALSQRLANRWKK